MSADDDFNVAIIGGGLAGLTLSIGLTSNGIKHKIYESAREFSEIGAGITMGPNAMTTLGLLDPRLKESFEKCATRNEAPELKDAFMVAKYGMATRPGTASFGDEITRVNCYSLMDKGRTSIHRAHFLDELIKYIPDGIAEFRKSAVDIIQDATGVNIQFQDGSTVRASVAVCCDGIKGMGRKIVLGKDSPNIAPKFTGEYAYRMLIPREEAKKHIDAGNGNIWCGHSGYIVTYPVAHGDLINMVAVKRHSEDNWDYPEWLTPTPRDKMMKDFEGWGAPILKLLEQVQDTSRWACFDNPDAETYFDGRICLVGDAAHASTPHQGAGAGMGFEDAFVLSSLLGSMENSSQVTEVFRAYDAVMRPRTQKLITTSRAAGQLYEMVLPGVGEDIGKMKDILQDWHEWIWKVDLPGQVKEAKKLMREVLAP